MRTVNLRIPNVEKVKGAAQAVAGNRKTHRGLQGKQEGLLGHLFSPGHPQPTSQLEKPHLCASAHALSTASGSRFMRVPKSLLTPFASRATALASSYLSQRHA